VCAAAVREAFFRLFKEGLIYRGKRLVNWDPVTQTALADDEVEMREVDGQFYYMKYPLEGTSDSVTVATTRPETFLGDTAVAVNPKDPQRAKFIGMNVRLPIVNRVIPIIGDDYVVIPDPGSEDAKAKYASGFLKVTPAHDPNDYEIGQRHGLAMLNVMAPDGTISDKHGWTDVGEAGFLVGMSREEARKAIVKWFKEHDLLAEVKPYRHAVGHSYRSHVPIEPYLSDQWYVKVTDDRLAGAALRAMAQHEPHTPTTSRDREGAVGAARAYLITWATYGSHLHGDSRGSIHHATERRGASAVPESEGLANAERDLIRGEPVSLNDRQRPVVRDTILEVCEHRGWRALAINVRAEHVHVVVEAADEPETVMNAFKSYATRRLREAGLAGADERLWARHGSTRYLNEPSSVAAARHYVVEEQGENLGETYHLGASRDREGAVEESHDSGKKKHTSTPLGEREFDSGPASPRPLPDGRGSSGELRFYPARYAKTFQTWHENIRDWCISRQLWWGHRIPVWSALHALPGDLDGGVDTRVAYVLRSIQALAEPADRIHISHETLPDTETIRLYVCIAAAGDRFLDGLAKWGFVQDPDVLDTWFSSGLWPISTLGWPEPSKFPEEFPDGDAPLKTWNPSDTLCTAREIITLWVSRMVMFNLFFRGCLPFKDVFIHAMIQDGEGQKMSKSLGNGVDPLDIIHSHGADAMRFTLTQMTTQTQDVRMPVDIVCPHCGETFHPPTKTTSAGHIVAAPIVDCPKCKRKMVSSYGVASGAARATDEMPAARNTSSKFDNGRNFANKLWNAGRFVLQRFSCGTGVPPLIRRSGIQAFPEDGRDARPTPDPNPKGDLPDRWVLSRLARTIEQVNAALSEYQFNQYVDTLYNFFWRDYCDWYVEAVKPNPPGSASEKILLAVLDASVRLGHPVMPFITEKLWENLNTVGADRSIAGLKLGPAELCVRAPWPQIEPATVDEQAESQFALVQDIVTAIRNVRSQYNVPPRQSVTVRVKAAGEQARTLTEAAGLVRTLAGAELTAIAADMQPASAAATIIVGSVELYIEGLIDPHAERERLSKRMEELSRSIAALQGRLNNPGYSQKAPAHLVQQTRDQLADSRRELAAVESKLAGL